MSIGTFGSFTQARLAIYAAQTGISVAGNNISNINTEGYTRQKLDQQSLYNKGTDRYYSRYDVRVGLGTLCTGVSQLRDPYLDIRYRNEMSDVGENDTKLQGLQQIQSILDEVGDGEITEGEDFGLLAAYFGEVYDSLSKLVGQTAHNEYDIQARTNCDTVAKQFNAYAGKLEQLYNNLVSQYETQVSQVNGLLTEIRDLSEQIRKNDIYGDKALEMRDLRNLKIDQLSEYMKIKVEYTTEDIGAGQSVEKLIIKMGNANPDAAVETDETVLIDGIYGAQISIAPKANPDYKENETIPDGYVPDPDKKDDLKYFKYLDPDGKPTNNAAEAAHNDNFDMVVSELRDARGKLDYFSNTKTKQISQADYDAVPDADKAKTETVDGKTTVTTYYQRGTKYYKQVYTREASHPVPLDDNDIHGRLQAQRELLTESGEFIETDTIQKVDETALGKRGIPYYQKALDLLANQFATAMNEANKGFLISSNGNYIGGDGKEIELAGAPINKTAGLTQDQTNALLADGCVDANGDADLERFLKAKGAISVGGNLFSNGGESDSEGKKDDPDDPPITASNISVSLSWSTGQLRIQNSFICEPDGMTTGVYKTSPAATDSTNILHIQAQFGTKRDFKPSTLLDGVSTDPMFRGTFEEMWIQMGTTLGQDQNIIKTELDSSYEAATELASSKDSVSGVDFNDEAMDLMMYAKSYNAACRLMTTIDSVLDKLINNTGLTT